MINLKATWSKTWNKFRRLTKVSAAINTLETSKNRKDTALNTQHGTKLLGYNLILTEADKKD